jgi:hypothetical protein
MTTTRENKSIPFAKLTALVLTVLASIGLAACGSDDESAEPDVAEEQESDSADGQAAGDGSGVAASEVTSPAVPPRPEQSVPALVDANSDDVTVGGYIFEIDGSYLLCEAATESDPPECDGQTLEIANGDVIDPAIFLGSPGSQYSDAEVVVTGDVSDGVLTIG